MFRNRISTGFTLLEILLVVVIVSILTAVGVNIINSQSIERVILNQAQKFSEDLSFVCEKAVLENQPYGFQFNAQGYQVLRYQPPQWLLIETQTAVPIDANISAALLLDGKSQQLQQDDLVNDENLPHIICQTDGSHNPFELRFAAAEGLSPATESELSYYALSTTSPWQLDGEWHQQ